MASNTKVDCLMSTIRELQQEKACLEQKLCKLRATKSSMETNQECMNTKHIQMKDREEKMKETLKVAQMKVNKTQGQIISLQGIVDNKKSHITDMNDRIKLEQNSYEESVTGFEQNLKQLAKELKAYRLFESKSLVQNKMTEHDENAQMIEVDRRKLVEELSELNKKLQELHIQKGNSDEEEDLPTFEISLKMQEQILSIADQESSLGFLSFESTLKELDAKQAELMQDYKQMVEQKQQLQNDV